MLANPFKLSLLALLPITAFAAHVKPLLNRHHDLAKRVDGDVQLFNRGAGARFSFYNAETGSQGSCGSYLSNSGFTVAVNAAQMNSGWCGKSITMTYNGQTTTATIADTCPGCPYNGLDLTPGLFSFFADQSIGIIYGDWEFAGAAAPPATTPTTTWTPAYTPPTTTWTPTSTWTPPKSSSTYHPYVAPSSSSSWSSHSYSSSSSSTKSSSIPTTTPTPTPDASTTTGNNLANLNEALVQMAGVVAAGPNV